MWFVLVLGTACMNGTLVEATRSGPLRIVTASDVSIAPNRGRPAVFIDKDGTLIEDVPYNVDPAQLRFTDGAIPALNLIASAGLPIAVVTNQPGLATGRFSRAQFARLQMALIDRVWEEAHVRLAGFYFCPHAPGGKSGVSCLCRKPAPGLLQRAASAEGYDLARSWMIGDILDDVEAGRRAGCRTILLDVGNETHRRVSPLRTPHHSCHDLLEAARIIVGVDNPLGFDDIPPGHHGRDLP